ncbi:unnamed protein product [Prunus armeniaca]
MIPPSSSSQNVMSSHPTFGTLRCRSDFMPNILLYRSIRWSHQRGASANGANQVDLSIHVRDRCLQWSGNILIQLSFSNQTFDDLPHTYALLCVMTVVLVVSAEFVSIPIVLPTKLSVIRLRDYFVLVYQNCLISGVQQSEDFLALVDCHGYLSVYALLRIRRLSAELKESPAQGNFSVSFPPVELKARILS